MSTDVIYLDNSATAWPKPPRVLDAMQRFLREDAANPGRSAHRMAVATERLITQCRTRVATLCNAEAPERIILTMNATDALNAAIQGVIRGLAREASGQAHVVSTLMEHNSVNRPLNTMAAAGMCHVDRVSFSADGMLDPGEIADAMTRDTVLLAITHGSNVLGTLQPVADIIAAARVKCPDVIVLVDASQTAGVAPIDVQAMDVDLLAATGHKGMQGPTGIGVLYISPKVYDVAQGVTRIHPYRAGGTGGDSNNPVMPTELPHCFESGTPNTVGIVGLSEGVAYVLERGVDAILTHERALVTRFLQGCAKRSDTITVYGPRDANDRLGAVSFSVRDLPPSEVAGIFDDAFNIAIRSGLHCAPNVHGVIGTHPTGTARVSVGPFTTREDIDAALHALDEISATV